MVRHGVAGQMVLFPSYLVHNVPDRTSKKNAGDSSIAFVDDDVDAVRVAWAFNLESSFGSWSTGNV